MDGSGVVEGEQVEPGRRGPSAAPRAERASRPLTGLAKRLYEEPFAFDFYQAVRLLQRLDPARAAVGRGGPPGAEAVRFRSHASLAFPPSAIHDLRRATVAEPVPVMTEAFFGLIGPNGVLPRHYTELILRLDRDNRGPERHALRDWLDLFNHRLVSLFYRAWEKYRFYGAYDREALGRPESSPFSRVVLSLAGLGTAPTSGRLEVLGPDGESARGTALARVDDLAILFYAGLFARRPRNATSLGALVGDYFRTPARVVQFLGQWLRLEPTNRTALAGSGPGQRLGVSTVVGERVYDVQSKFRLRLGPMPYETFLELLPDREPIPARKGFFLLCQLVRLYVGVGLDFDVQLVLRAGDVPEYPLGDESGVGSRLGWNVWVAGGPPGRDADDAVFEAEELDASGGPGADHDRGEIHAG